MCDLLDEVGPDAPTLCEGWTTRDLAAHLVVRESRPDASVGIVVRPMNRWTEKVQEDAAAKPYEELVSKVRNGPPTLSVFALPGIDAMANTMEYFIHHEDVRRAIPGWVPRDLDPGTKRELWGRLRSSKRMLFRSAPMTVVLQPTDVPDFEGSQQPPGSVVIRGPVVELAMHGYGRSEVRDLQLLGDTQDLDRYRSGTRGV